MASPSHLDPEKGLASSQVRMTMSSTASSSGLPENLIAHAPLAPAVEEAHTPLELFQLLIGIRTPETFEEGYFTTDHTNPQSSRPRSGVVETTKANKAQKARGREANVGLWQRSQEEARRARIQYIATSTISNTLFLAQIILAATFTALSAYKETSAVTLTILGATNTVIAGCLAWQKGQGVPQRYRKCWDQFEALVLEIEMAERSFLELEHLPPGGPSSPDPRAELARLQKLFDVAKADQQANYPDLYVSTGANAKEHTQELAKQLEDVKAEAAKTQEELLARIAALVDKVEGKVEAKLETKVADAVEKVLD